MTSFFVPGIPAPGGSKKGFVNPKTGRVVIVDDAKRNTDWRSMVGLVASQHFAKPLEGPVRVVVTFYMPRPQGHFGKRGLRPGAPAHPITRPDCSKVWRSTEDALKGIAWFDDAQVVTQMIRKSYAVERPGAQIEIESLTRDAQVPLVLKPIGLTAEGGLF